MNISEIFAFLVHAEKGVEAPRQPQGMSVPLNGELYGHLEGIFRKSQDDCNVDVAMRVSIEGEQSNQFRDMLVSFARDGTLETAMPIASHLAANTTRRSSLGLLFLIRAKSNAKFHVLLSRFPTDTAILVDDLEDGLNVKFLDKVFVKTYYTYKAALFSGQAIKGDFLEGRVLDRQTHNSRDDASRYWVRDFLQCEFKVTSYHGTMRFARAIADASAGASFEEKRELHHIAGVLENYEGRDISCSSVLDSLAASDLVKGRVREKIGAVAFDQSFQFSREAYNSIISFRTVETIEGAILTADSASFERVFQYETVRKDGDREIVRLITEGVLAADKLRRSK